MAEPVDDATFARAIGRFGYFEAAPALAVACSGGPDSLALTWLADRWARERGGRVTALVVDHELRRESAAEASAVLATLAACGIAGERMAWTGPKPTTGVPAAARAARYALLEGWCADRGILHLLTAHHRDDQTETVLLNLGRGSGVDGLSGIAAEVIRPFGRLLRPLLDLPKARLEATCTAAGLDPVRDPSNTNLRFGRNRIRTALASGSSAPDRVADRLADTASHCGRARHALQAATAAVLARAFVPNPAGFGELDLVGFADASEDIRLRVVLAVAGAVAGLGHPPRIDRTRRLLGEWRSADPRPRTFSGACWRVRPGGSILVTREPSAIGPSVDVWPGHEVWWDGRFRVTVDRSSSGVRVASARDSIPLIRRERPATRFPPSAAWAGMPALFDLDGPLAVPHLDWYRSGINPASIRVVPDPSQPFAAAIPPAAVGPEGSPW